MFTDGDISATNSFGEILMPRFVHTVSMYASAMMGEDYGLCEKFLNLGPNHLLL